MRRTRPETRALALDWTAWGGIGMATRGSIPKIMEMAGVGMLPPEAGVAWIRRELTAHGSRGEVVVAGALGQMAAGHHPSGGLDPTAVDTSGAGPMVGTVVGVDLHDGLVAQVTLDPIRQPFLDDHRIDGTAVLPGVMGMEAFAEAARLLVPEWHVVAVEEVDFRAPVKFYRDEPRTLTVTARIRPDGGDLVADCRLLAERLLPGSETPQQTLHFNGSVRLAARRPDDQGADRVTHTPDAPVLVPDDVYRLYFHGPAYRVVGEAWRQDGAAAGAMARDLPAGHDPASGPTVLGPRLVELCFQVAGLWEAGQEGRLALPAHVDSLRVLADPATVEGPVVSVARPSGSLAGCFDCDVVDAGGRRVLQLAGYRTVPMPGVLPGDVLAPLHSVMTG
jgi:hypothetical protein